MGGSASLRLTTTSTSSVEVKLFPTTMHSIVVYFVRHGQTAHNAQRIIQGQLDTDLDDVGRAQAQIVANGLSDVPFTHAFTSDARRAADAGNFRALSISSN